MATSLKSFAASQVLSLTPHHKYSTEQMANPAYCRLRNRLGTSQR